jgi:integrase
MTAIFAFMRILPESLLDVRAFVGGAYALDDKLGLLTDTLAVTGARPSQAVRLRVEDLHDHPVRPKLMMPKSAKGGDRNRAEKKLERYSVPITLQLAARLREAAKGRADDAPLFLKGDGRPWGDNPGAGYHREVEQIGVGAQDCHAELDGARTGDISAAMVADAGAKFIILGHSERRMGHGEDNTIVAAKIDAAMAAGLRIILCCGESL